MRSRVVFAAVLPLVLMIGLAGLLVWQLNNLFYIAQNLDQTDHIIAEAQRSLKLAVDMETGLRGFELTGDNSYLAPYNDAAARFKSATDHLAQMVSDDPEQIQRLDEFRTLHQQWMDHARGAIARRHADQRPTTASVNEGKSLMDGMRKAIADFVASEEHARAEHSRRAAAAATGTTWMTAGVLIATGLLFAFVTARQLLALARSHDQALAELREQMQAVASSENRLRAVFETAAVGIGEVSVDGHILRANRRLCEITGYSEDELLQLRTQDISCSDHVAQELEQRNRVLAGEIQTYSREKQYVRKDGSMVWVNITSSLLRDSDGHPRHFVCVVEDISRRKAAVAAQESSESRLKLALEAAGMGTWEWDIQTDKTSGSERLAEIFGAESGKCDCTAHAAFDHIHPEDRDMVMAAITAAIEGRAPTYHCVYRVVWPDGSVHWVAADGDVLRDTAGKATHVVGIARDITERRLAEQERQDLLLREQRARAEAEAANRRKDQFLAVLSHELRTPLTPVLARLMLLRASPNLPRDMCEALDMMRRNVELEARLIDDLLDITRIARGKMHLSAESVDVHEKVRNALDIYQGELRSKNLNLRVKLNAEHHTVRGDPARLQQVFWNLISNAVKYTPPNGSITIRSFNRPPAAPSGNGGAPPSVGEDRIIIEVADTGIGIEPDLMSRLFDPFEQGEQVLARRFSGLGLGLAISRNLVNLHGGKLTADSPGKNRGATFSVELKTIPVPSEAAPLPAEPSKPSRSLHILLVEDNQDTLRVMSRLLRSDGHQVRTASSVRQAIDTASQNKFDLVISDIGLPDGSGWELMRTLRSRGPVRGIALSGFSMDEDIQKSKSSGFLEHLAKPINPQELEEAIARAVP